MTIRPADIRSLVDQVIATVGDATALPPPRNSIWELTADALGVYPDDPVYMSDVYIGVRHVFEIEVPGGAYIPVARDVFDAWVGLRRLDGDHHHGPVHCIGTGALYTGPRACPCTTCQSTTMPQLRMN